MAASQSPEASEIRRRGRQRLIGAVAIALLLIVFVPMLHDSEPRPARDDPKLEIPPRENAPPLPAPVEPKSAEFKSAASPPAATPPAAKVAVVEPKADPKADAKVAIAKPAPAPATTATPAASAKAEGFAIQVGAYREDTTLQQVREKLTASKITTYTEPSGELTRLRVGPFPTRDAAEKTAAIVRKSVPDAKVVPLP